MGQVHSNEERASCESCLQQLGELVHEGGGELYIHMRMQEPFWSADLKQDARTSRELPHELVQDSTRFGYLKDFHAVDFDVHFAPSAKCPDLEDWDASTLSGEATVTSREVSASYSTESEFMQSTDTTKGFDDSMGMEPTNSLSYAGDFCEGGVHLKEAFTHCDLFASSAFSSTTIDIDEGITSKPTQNIEEAMFQTNVTKLLGGEATRNSPLIDTRECPQHVGSSGHHSEQAEWWSPFETRTVPQEADGVSSSNYFASDYDAKHLGNEGDNPSYNVSDTETLSNSVQPTLTDTIGMLEEAKDCTMKASIVLEGIMVSIERNDPGELQLVNDDDDSLDSHEKLIEVGDIVVLCQGVPREYCGHAAIVTEAAENHCTVAVLDESRRYGVGECWPNYDCIELDSTVLRLGTRIVVDGLQSARTKHLNGHLGVISKHPRQGHPNFIKKAASPDTPQLTVCVVFEDASLKEHSALLEPRFLKAWEDASFENTKSLSETAAMLMAAHDKPCKDSNVLQTNP